MELDTILSLGIVAFAAAIIGGWFGYGAGLDRREYETTHNGLVCNSATAGERIKTGERSRECQLVYRWVP